MEPQGFQPFPKRRAPGKYGGKPVKREFFFAPRDGDKYPSESTVIRNNRLPDSPNRMPSWTWALMHAIEQDVWLVVPCGQQSDPEAKTRDISMARSGVWRTGQRHGLEMTSEYVYPNLYVKVVG